MITIKLFSVVVIIFTLHTVLTHLINWQFRKSDDESTMFATLIFAIIEITIIIALLDYYIE